MSRFINPTGHANFGIGICDRCKQKFPLDMLFEDPNSPGLKVCVKDRDVYDPWRLAPRETEDISLPFYRPDENIALPGTAVAAKLVKIGGNFFWNVDGGALGEVDIIAIPVSTPYSSSLDFSDERNSQYVPFLI